MTPTVIPECHPQNSCGIYSITRPFSKADPGLRINGCLAITSAAALPTFLWTVFHLGTKRRQTFVCFLRLSMKKNRQFSGKKRIQLNCNLILLPKKWLKKKSSDNENHIQLISNTVEKFLVMCHQICTAEPTTGNHKVVLKNAPLIQRSWIMMYYKYISRKEKNKK